MAPPVKVLLLNIDGLRRDIFLEELARGSLPALDGLVGSNNSGGHLHLAPVSCAPSVTFCCQATIATGVAPKRHGIVGNQYFDRLGTTNRGKPRYYAFDVGERRVYRDALAAFRGPVGLTDRVIPEAIPTIYERARAAGKSSVVINCMIARGAGRWLRPSVFELARFTKGSGMFGLSPERFDRRMVERFIRHLDRHGVPDLMMAYFMGVDHVAHKYGPEAQRRQLVEVTDPLVGRLVDRIRARHPLERLVVVVLSDHGSQAVRPERRFQLMLHDPLARVSRSLPLRNHLVGASNGGLASVYVRSHGAEWNVPADFRSEVLPTAEAMLRSSVRGDPVPAYRGGLLGVFVRDCRTFGWEAPWTFLGVGGERTQMDSEGFLHEGPLGRLVDPGTRLEGLRTASAGDILLVPDMVGGFHFGNPARGMHGGLEAGDSVCVLSVGRPQCTADVSGAFTGAVEEVVRHRLTSTGRRRPNLEEIAPLVAHFLGLADLSAPSPS